MNPSTFKTLISDSLEKHKLWLDTDGEKGNRFVWKEIKKSKEYSSNLGRLSFPMHKVDFSRAILDGMDFIKFRIVLCSFNRASLDGVNLRGQNLAGSDFRGAHFGKNPRRVLVGSNMDENTLFDLKDLEVFSNCNFVKDFNNTVKFFETEEYKLLIKKHNIITLMNESFTNE